MFNVSVLLLDDALKPATPLTNGANFWGPPCIYTPFLFSRPTFLKLLAESSVNCCGCISTSQITASKHWRLVTNTAAYSFQDGRVGVQVSAWYGSVLFVDILRPNVITRRSVSPSLCRIWTTLFHARRRTTVIAASLLAVRLYGTVCQLHFD